MNRFAYPVRKYIHVGEVLNVSKELNNMGRVLATEIGYYPEWNNVDKCYWIGWTNKEGVAFDGQTMFYGSGKFGHWIEYRVAVTDADDVVPDEVFKWVRWEI